MTTAEISDVSFYLDTDPARLLRKRLRTLIAEHLPPWWLGPFTNDPADLVLSNRFCEILAKEGLLVPDWPVEYGGKNADLISSIVMREEMWANFEPRGPQYYGPNWVGPSIADYGTPEQKALHLPKIAAGRAIWAQGFSEPEAGSDLKNMKTRAVRDGDGYRITGQKVWTSWALWAKWFYLLARVEGGGENKRDGITVFILPMDRHGITIRGLDGMPGPHHLTEVFLDDVWASSDEVLGPIGNGWQVIRDALSNERVGVARYARDDRLIATVMDDKMYREALPPSRWLRARVRNRMSRLMCRRALAFQDDGGSHDFIVCAARLITTRSDLLVADTLSEAVGDRFFEHRYAPEAAVGGALEWFWRYMQCGTIATGTTEMLQRQLSRAMFTGERIRVTPGGEDVRLAFDRLLGDLGGVELARAAMADPATRHALVAEVDEFIEGLDPREGHNEAIAAAEVCRAAGRVALPLPIEAMLLRRSNGRPVGLLSPNGRLEHGDLFPEWDALTTGGASVQIAAAADLIGSKVGPFVNRTPVDTRGEAEQVSVAEQALLHVLSAFYLLGAMERAVELATVHATERVAFGAPISSYQGVSFPLADACSELQAVYELALHALWNVFASPATARVDALALRWAAIDAARPVLRTAHQVFGAVGLCDEHDLTIISFAVQARRRLPYDVEATMSNLNTAVEQDGFDSLYTPVKSH